MLISMFWLGEMFRLENLMLFKLRSTLRKVDTIIFKCLILNDLIVDLEEVLIYGLVPFRCTSENNDKTIIVKHGYILII